MPKAGTRYQLNQGCDVEGRLSFCKAGKNFSTVPKKPFKTYF